MPKFAKNPKVVDVTKVDDIRVTHDQAESGLFTFQPHQRILLRTVLGTLPLLCCACHGITFRYAIDYTNGILPISPAEDNSITSSA